MSKTLIGVVIGSMIAFSGESLRTNAYEHDCVRDASCYDMKNCDWRITEKHTLHTDVGKYYPYCSWTSGCQCKKCEDDRDECESFFSSVSSSDQEEEDDRESGKKKSSWW